MIQLLEKLRIRETERETTPDLRYRELLMQLAQGKTVTDEAAEEIVLSANRDVSTLEADVKATQRRLDLIAATAEQQRFEDHIAELELEKTNIQSECATIVAKYRGRIETVTDRVKGEKVEVERCETARKELLHTAPDWIDEVCDSLQPRIRTIWQEMKEKEYRRSQFNPGHAEHTRLGNERDGLQIKLAKLSELRTSIQELKAEPWAIPSDAKGFLNEAEEVIACTRPAR